MEYVSKSASPFLTKSRIQSIDFLRGLIMVVMALDHTRDFFHATAFTGNPLDPASSYPALYFTRWITHFCAPTFVFLSGLSAWLQGQRKTKKELRRFLIIRGTWLILFDLTIMTFIMTLDIHFEVFVLETLWSIGAGMIILGLLTGLRFRHVLTIGLIIFFGHNLLDLAEQSAQGNLPVWWDLLHRTAIVPLWGSHKLFIFYPFLPWAGLMLLGYCCGIFFTNYDFFQRRKILTGLGAAAIIFFLALRAVNIYGDPIPWQMQKSTLATFFSFMNLQKYPPSLLYLCATMGPVLIFLGLVKNSGSKFQKKISVFGRVPFFYFAVHFLILHVATSIAYLCRGHTFAEGLKGVAGVPFKFIMPGEGYSLWLVYAFWAGIVLLMYPLCKWYNSYKTNHKGVWWLSYL